MLIFLWIWWRLQDIFKFRLIIFKFNLPHLGGRGFQSLNYFLPTNFDSNQSKDPVCQRLKLNQYVKRPEDKILSKDWAAQFCPSKYMSDAAGPLPMTWALGCQRLVRSGLLLCFKRETKEKKRKNMSDHLSIEKSALSFPFQSFLWHDA